MRRSFRVVTIAATVAVLVIGCGNEVGRRITGEPVSLPPMRATATATPPAELSLPPELALPTATPTPLAPPRSTVEPSPPPGAVSPTAASARLPSPTPEVPLKASPTLEPTPSPEGPLSGEVGGSVTVTPIGRLGSDLLGQEVTVEGVVVDTGSFSSGFRFTLDDGTGQVVLLMWHAVYDDCREAAGLNQGARVRVTGEVSRYEGVLQVEPAGGGAVGVLEPAAAWADPRSIGSLSGVDEGQRVMIEGEVVRTEGREDWAKVFLSDGTGEIVVFIWRNILDRIPGNTGLGAPDSRVRVVGTVTVYRSNLEVVPALPYDVVVLGVP